MSLPKSFNLAENIPSLPEHSSSTLISCRPVSGSSFLPSSIIDIDLGSRGWLDPKSLAIRYKCVVVSDVSACSLIGVPLYTPFQNLRTVIQGTVVDNIAQFNQVQFVLTNGSLGISEKYGLQTGYGFANTSTNGNNMEYLDGRITALSTTDTFFMAGPLPCLLSNCEKMIPLFTCGAIRLSFTLDSLANMFFDSGTTYKQATSITISNFEVVYNCIDLGREVESMVKGMGPRLFLKSHTYNNSATAVASGAVGSNSYVFNQRLSSIRSAFILPNRTTGNKWGEIVDITTGNGDYQLQIGSSGSFPMMPLSTILNDSGILQETRRAFSNLYDYAGMSINSNEFSLTSNTSASSLSPVTCGKFYVGVALEKCQNTDHVLMSGVSTYNSPINVVINIGTATSNACNLNLLLDYDAILVIDQESHQLSVRS